MVFILFRRFSSFKYALNVHLVSNRHWSSPRKASMLGNAIESTQPSSMIRFTSSNYSSGLHLSPLSSDNTIPLEDRSIELVDDETWRISSSLTGIWRSRSEVFETKAAFHQENDETVKCVSPEKGLLDFDKIEDLRIRGNLFYKIDRDSREFEEYSFDFHRRKPSMSTSERKGSKKGNLGPENNSRVGTPSKNKDAVKTHGKKKNSKDLSAIEREKLFKVSNSDHIRPSLHKMVNTVVENKQRIPTFNQLTAPYHEPFCLDVYVSKGSVRASIIHRATSKVVAVAHSISKDMKFDLASIKNRTACAAVGKVLAERALADDIHNVVYTPRKGERLEGKLEVVVQTIIDSGVNVKVKIKLNRKNASKAKLEAF